MGDVMVYCGKCGALNPDDNLFCGACGKPLGTPTNSYVPPTPTLDQRADEERNRYMVYKWPAYISSVLVGVVALIMIFCVPFEYSVSGSDITQSYTLWQFVDEGFNGTLTLLVVLSVVLCLAGFLCTIVGWVGAVLGMMTLMTSSILLQDIEILFLKVDLVLADPVMALATYFVPLMIMMSIAIVFEYLFDKAFLVGKPLVITPFMKV